MKKIFLLIICSMMLLCGCSQSAVPEIDDFSWILVSVQSHKGSGQIIAYGPRMGETSESDGFCELVCTAKDGVISMQDKTNGKFYTGTYEFQGKDPRSSNYKITIDGQEGIAVVAMTTYHDKTQDPTFIINLEDHSIKFFAKK